MFAMKLNKREQVSSGRNKGQDISVLGTLQARQRYSVDEGGGYDGSIDLKVKAPGVFPGRNQDS